MNYRNSLTLLVAVALVTVLLVGRVIWRRAERRLAAHPVRVSRADNGEDFGPEYWTPERQASAIPPNPGF
jgi:hypothetical protein